MDTSRTQKLMIHDITYNANNQEISLHVDVVQGVDKEMDPDEELDRKILLAFYVAEEPQSATDEKVTKIINSFKKKAAERGGDWRDMMYSAFKEERGVDPRKHWDDLRLGGNEKVPDVDKEEVSVDQRLWEGMMFDAYSIGDDPAALKRHNAAIAAKSAGREFTA